MVTLKESSIKYSTIDSLVYDISPDVDRIAKAFIRHREDFLGDCKQNLFIHVIEAFHDSSSCITFQNLINKIWWRAMDFVKRDSSYNFWKNHVPFTEHISLASVNSRYYGKFVEYPEFDANIDLVNLINYACDILNERDFRIFSLHLNGFSFSEISEIIYPIQGDRIKSVRKIKSAIWRMRKKFRLGFYADSTSMD